MYADQPRVAGRETGKVRRYCPQSGQALLAQERRLKEIEEGRKRTEEELRVQAQGLEDGEPTGLPENCPALRAEGSRASTGASVEEGTLQGGTEGALKGPSGAGWLPPQLQGLGPRRGVEPQTDKVREAVKGASEGPQTPETGVEAGLDPPTTPSKPGDRSGGFAS